MEGSKSFLDDLAASKPESFKEEKFIRAKRSFKSLAFILVFAIIAAALYFMIQKSNETMVPDMAAWKLEEIQNWVQKNHSNTTLKGVYSLEHPVNTFISQDIEAGQKVKKQAPMVVTYSLGGDPNEAIKLPDLKTLTLDAINEWIQTNQLTGISFRYENSEVIPKDSVISFDIIDGTKDSFLRKNRITVYVSNGTGSTDDTFEMPDFFGKTKGEVLHWADENQVEVTFEEAWNENFDYGVVYHQSIKKETKITRKDAIVLNLSLGLPVKVPDFRGLSRSEASELAALHKISVFFKYQTSDQEPDRVISQDTGIGAEITRDKIITLTVSKKKDQVTVPDFLGMTTQEANNLASLYNVKIFIKNLSDDDKKTRVISQSMAFGSIIKQEDIVTLLVDAEEETADTLPNFVGLTRNEATVAAQNKSIQLVFNEIKTTTVANNTIIKQSIEAGSPLDTKKTLLLDIAVNSGVIAKDLTSMTKTAAQTWATQNGVTLNIIDQYSDIRPAGALYNQSLMNGLIPDKGSITIYHSLGQVGVDNFVGKSKLDVLNWQKEVNGKGAKITLTFNSDGGSTSPKGTVTNQSIKAELVKMDENITFWVSSIENSGTKIPGMDDMTESEFKLWCSLNQVPYIINDSYSDVYRTGRVFNQSYSGYLPKGEYLRVYKSLGRVIVPDFSGQDKSQVTAWQNEVNASYASISITYSQSYSDSVPEGKIMDQSVKNSVINTGSAFNITLSLGPDPNLQLEEDHN